MYRRGRGALRINKCSRKSLELAVLEIAVLEIVGCPDCAAPAEVADRFTLASTNGPVGHVAVICSAGHRFRMRAEGLSAPGDAAPTSDTTMPAGSSHTSSPTRKPRA